MTALRQHMRNLRLLLLPSLSSEFVLHFWRALLKVDVPRKRGSSQASDLNVEIQLGRR